MSGTFKGVCGSDWWLVGGVVWLVELFDFGVAQWWFFGWVGLSSISWWLDGKRLVG